MLHSQVPGVRIWIHLFGHHSSTHYKCGLWKKYDMAIDLKTITVALRKQGILVEDNSHGSLVFLNVLQVSRMSLVVHCLFMDVYIAK
jgi:hypothetical protein